jgi:hypothetical protein
MCSNSITAFFTQLRAGLQIINTIGTDTTDMLANILINVSVPLSVKGL